METKVLKQAVRRNIRRFPEDFMFELTLEEDRRLRSRNVTLKKVNIQNMVQWPSQNKVTMPEFKG
ncbi:MAG: ORF6N domain-containing protein [Desulfatirhabdiaceae bacterium]